jgi:hypothetical protein
MAKPERRPLSLSTHLHFENLALNELVVTDIRKSHAQMLQTD